MFGELLLEIGTEEIPSDYLEGGLQELRQLAESHLRDNRIGVKEGLATYGTPRRLVLVGQAIAGKQEDVAQEMTGPPKSAAFDEQGKPTKAAFGFAKKQGLSVDELQILKTPKGEYLYIKRMVPGRPTREILSEILPGLIGKITWPKSMRWGTGEFAFVRPIHWILALYDGEVIPFKLGGVTSGDKTRGHRFMAPHIMEIHNLGDYLDKMRQSSVIIDQKEREKEVEKVAATAAKTVSGEILKDPELLTTVANMVELPSAVCGSFDKEFLKLPAPVLITAMKEHQRYFSIRDKDGRLMPHFVAINNTIARDESVVRIGHERVLRARLADADFFFKEDRKRPLADRLEDLKEVIYHAQLGTSFAKVERFTELAEYLAELIAPERKDDIRLAASLCKCDLDTEVVMEFPSLQGIMGEIYAGLDGHPDEVCRAISDHYLPTQADSNLPESLIGAIVGLADRMDTIVGFFAIGLEPTGTADPYALRRQTLAIIRLIRDKGIAVSIPDFVAKAGTILSKTISFNREEVIKKVLDFLKDRLRHMLLSEDITHDFIDAVMTTDFNYLQQIEARIAALQRFRDQSADFEALSLSFKRITNMVKDFETNKEVSTELFESESEQALWKSFQEVRDKAEEQMDKENYFETLNVMATLCPPIDDFFEKVMVMAKDRMVRENRLVMLKQLYSFFLKLADFSKFSF
jgi:glycyl-tRNA synthetase beta chain